MYTKLMLDDAAALFFHAIALFLYHFTLCGGWSDDIDAGKNQALSDQDNVCRKSGEYGMVKIWQA